MYVIVIVTDTVHTYMQMQFEPIELIANIFLQRIDSRHGCMFLTIVSAHKEALEFEDKDLSLHHL